jgi:Family of unknown function (DUF6098)
MEEGDRAGPATITALDQLAELVERTARDPYVRFARVEDVAEPSVDHVSGLTLPGVAVNPLRPPGWWTGRTTADWVARQIGTYSHLQQADPRRLCWVVHGDVIDRGPDNEPLLTNVEVVGVVASELVAECMPDDQNEGARGEPPAWQQPT